MLSNDLQGGRTRLGPQITDVVEAEAESSAQDGLTPVRITAKLHRRLRGA